MCLCVCCCARLCACLCVCACVCACVCVCLCLCLCVWFCVAVIVCAWLAGYALGHWHAGVALRIVGWLPVQSVTALACTCRAARALTLTPSLWTTLYARDLVPRRSYHEPHGIGTLSTLPAPLGLARCGRDGNATEGSFTSTHRLRDGDADSRSKYWQRLRARRVWVVAAAVVHQYAIDRPRAQHRFVCGCVAVAGCACACACACACVAVVLAVPVWLLWLWLWLWLDGRVCGW